MATVDGAVWRVELVEGPTREFLDLHALVGSYYRLHPRFLKKLQEQIKCHPIYRVRAGIIRKAADSKSRQLDAPFILLLITHTGLTVSLLGNLSSEEDEGGHLVGVWPAQFSHVLKADPQALINLLYLVSEQPQSLRRMDLLF